MLVRNFSISNFANSFSFFFLLLNIANSFETEEIVYPFESRSTFQQFRERLSILRDEGNKRQIALSTQPLFRARDPRAGVHNSLDVMRFVEFEADNFI